MLALCGGNAEARTLDEIIKSGSIKVGVNPTLVPLGKFDEKNEIAGFDVDYATEIAKMLGVKLEVVQVGSPDRIPEYRFRGYRLVDGYPEFHYQVDGVDVHERVSPSANPMGLRRQFTIARIDREMWLLDGRFAGDRMALKKGAPVQFEVILPVEVAK